MTDHNRLHNPNYIGPGIWYTIHSLAADAKTPQEKTDVIRHIRKIQSRFPCNDCKVHFGNYLEYNPPEMTVNGSPESLFAWTVNFHNSVNHRLNKPQVSYNDAKSIFMEESIFCMTDCTESETKTPPRIVPKDIPGYIF
jgi:hypothetical protein